MICSTRWVSSTNDKGLERGLLLTECQYCLENATVCKTIDDAEALFATHRYFLFASMLDNKEGLQWAKIPLFKYFETNFPVSQLFRSKSRITISNVGPRMIPHSSGSEEPLP